jgi:hypothetical protein
MMDAIREKLLTNPEHVLTFVEGVLSDEAQTLSGNEKKTVDVKEGKKPLMEIVEADSKPKGPLIEEMDEDEELPELTEAGVEKLGMVETAISLLLASLEGTSFLQRCTNNSQRQA